MNIQNELITPQIAKEMLGANSKNRKVKADRVKKYAIDIELGKWVQNTGESIKIASSGELLDGQHRLMAIIKADKPIEMLVVRGLDENVFKVIDSGVSRSSADVLAIQGIKSQHACAAIILKRFNLTDSLLQGRMDIRLKKYSSNDILEAYLSDPALWDGIILNTSRWYNAFGKVIPQSTIGSLYSIFRDIDSEQAFQYFEYLSTGVDIKNKMFYHLRNTLIKNKVSVKKMSQLKILALIVKGWNKFREGDESNCQFDETKHTFPKPI